MHLMIAPFVFLGLGASVLNRKFRAKNQKNDSYTITISSLILVDSSEEEESRFNEQQSEIVQKTFIET